jgi:hypothetical protein
LPGKPIARQQPSQPMPPMQPIKPMPSIEPIAPIQPMLVGQGMRGVPVAMAMPTIYEPGKIYFISPDDKVRQEAPRSAWQIDILREYINGVLDHAKKQLVGDVKLTDRKERAK